MTVPGTSAFTRLYHAPPWPWHVSAFTASMSSLCHSIQCRTPELLRLGWGCRLVGSRRRNRPSRSSGACRRE